MAAEGDASDLEAAPPPAPPPPRPAAIGFRWSEVGEGPVSKGRGGKGGGEVDHLKGSQVGSLTCPYTEDMGKFMETQVVV